MITENSDLILCVVRAKANDCSLYIVPVGSNPCGSTMNGERRKAVYDVCVKYGKLLLIFTFLLLFVKMSC